jgi:hypothetical protein
MLRRKWRQVPGKRVGSRNDLLVGQLDFPYARRVAVALRVLALPTNSVFADFDAMPASRPARPHPVRHLYLWLIYG